jgi:hypothetical protein
MTEGLGRWIDPAKRICSAQVERGEKCTKRVIPARGLRIGAPMTARSGATPRCRWRSLDPARRVASNRRGSVRSAPVTFSLNAVGMSAQEARTTFYAACDYLRQSDMAASVLDELGRLPERIVIFVGNDLEPKYRHPTVDDGQDGGIVEWNPTLALGVFDSARMRPKAPWVRNRVRRSGPFGLGRTPVNEEGVMSPAVGLIHELGHAYQFFGDRAAYRASLNPAYAIEDNVVGAIENVVVMELREKGHNEGLRWHYGHTRRLDADP